MISDNSKVISVLIVDDDAIDREVYKRLMANYPSANYQVYEAESGEEGLEYCSAGIPDCILLDYCIADMDGLEFLDHISNSDGEVSIPVIMLTGQGNEKIAVEAMKRGVKDYLIKKLITEKDLNKAIKCAVEPSADMIPHGITPPPFNNHGTTPPANWTRI